MKKILIFTVFLFVLLALPKFVLPAFADSTDDFGDGAGSFGDYGKSIDDSLYKQKPVTDENFEKTMQKLESKKKGKKKKQFKGTSMQEADHSKYLDEVAENYLLLLLPLDLVLTDGTEIPVGHYKITARKEKDKVFIDFYQAYSLVASTPAILTDSDFGQTGINFVKIFPYDESHVKLIYGSVDLNAYAFINIKNPLQ